MVSCTFSLLQLAKKKAHAARGWFPPHQASCIDPMDQSHPLDPTLNASGAIGFPTIRLLKNDTMSLIKVYCVHNQKVSATAKSLGHK